MIQDDSSHHSSDLTRREVMTRFIHLYNNIDTVYTITVYIQCGAPKIAKLVYNSNNLLITIVYGRYIYL